MAPVEGRRQIWVRLLAGGTPLQITRDDADHDHPRWSPDSSAIVYFASAAREGAPGALWEVPALGGTPRRLAASTGGADLSHDGRRLATFQNAGAGIALTILERNGAARGTLTQLAARNEYASPRWSPDDRSIAFVADEGTFRYVLYVNDAAGGSPRVVAHATEIKGIAWLPDGSGLVYASSLGSMMAYPAVFNLRTVSRDGGIEHQLTVGDVSYVHPDIVQSGKVFTSRVRMQSDIWRFPVSGLPSENVKKGIRITQQTGQVQTPSPSPDQTEVAYLSDSGGHANVWVAKTNGSGSRQLTFENDPAVIIGIPVWSPAGDRIAFIRNVSGRANNQWLINPDGRLLEGIVR